jgi:hypothetical protein
VQGIANSGDFIVCKLVVLDDDKRTISGTVKSIIDTMQSEKSCNVSEGGNKMEKGGGINECLSYIETNKENILANGYCYYFGTLGVLKDVYTYVNEPEYLEDLQFLLITYNSGGQDNLKVTDTVNSLSLRNEIKKLFGCSDGLAKKIVSKYLIRAKKFDEPAFETYKNEKIIIANRDEIVCQNVVDEMEKGGGINKLAFIKKYEEWGYVIKTKARFSFADDSVGVLFATKKITTNKNNALVICTTYSFTAYYNNWKKDLNLSKDTYVLCDVTSGKNIPSNSILDFIQDNIINYTQENVKKSLNFNTQPSDKHWWTLGGGRSMMWFYAHLRMLYFYKTHPEYDYYWFFDDDVTFPNQQLNEFLEAHSNLDYDCMITYLFSNIGNKNPSRVPFVGPGMGSYHVPEHNWLTHYPGDGDIQPPQVTEKYGSYFPIARFSNTAIKILLQEHGKGYCGYSEGYVPTILNHKGLSLYSIYNPDNQIKVDKNIIVHHRR